MGGVYRALCEQGLASLTMDDIAAEADVSPALLHYHYDTKHNLLLSYLEYAQQFHEDNIAGIRADHAAAIDQLSAILETFVTDPGTYNQAYLQLRLEAVHDEAFREACLARRETILDELSAIIARGIEEGTVREGDPERMAHDLYTFMDGARVQQVVLGAETDTESLKRSALDYIRA